MTNPGIANFTGLDPGCNYDIYAFAICDNDKVSANVVQSSECTCKRGFSSDIFCHILSKSGSYRYLLLKLSQSFPSI